MQHGFSPILRNDDEKAGVEIGAGFGISSAGPLQGTSKETLSYKTKKDESGIEKEVLEMRQFGRNGNFENRFPGFASHAAAAFYTDSPLGLHADAAFSREDDRTYYSYDLGLSLTSAFQYIGFALFICLPA